ncbi:MAG: phenylalanine--tRNA ligase subunit beta [Chthoniobacterales bacterium]
MLVSLEWLKEYIDLDCSLEEIVERLTRAGLSVEDVQQTGGDIPGVVVAKILESEAHPNADRLSVCLVEDGSGEPRQIVCGAKNYKVGDKVPLALPGAVLPGNFKIKPGKLRGVKSEGMMCSGKELGLTSDSAGLLILPEEAEVGQGMATLFPSATVLDLEITPNRADWLGHVGVARELAAFDPRGTAQLRQPMIPGVMSKSAAGGEVTISADAACSFYALRKIRGVRIEPSPDWLCKRLEACGLRPINNVVDITNYVMLELGQPLHAFDASKIADEKITVRLAEEGEIFKALDEAEYKLTTADTLIADAAGSLALAGIMGGLESGVTGATTDILLESASFDPSAIRRTSKRLLLHTDSSYRFERGIDPTLAERASIRATELIVQLAGGTVEPEIIFAGEKKYEPLDITLRHARAAKLLGVNLSDEEIYKSLESFGCERLTAKNTSNEASVWRIPSWRLDLLREVDLIEELSRSVGIENIPSRLLAVPAEATKADAFYDFAWELRQALVQAGFCEAHTSTLVSKNSVGDAPALPLRNPLGEEQSHLRPSLIPGLLTAAERNFHYGENALRLFEIGRIYLAEQPEESYRLGLVVSGILAPPYWADAGATSKQAYDFFALKGLLARLFGSSLSLIPVEREDCVVAADLQIGKKKIGFMGIVTPARAAEIDAPKELLVAELDFTHALVQHGKVKQVAELDKFPSARRDLALVLKNEVTYRSVVDAIQSLRLPSLRSVDAFDLFRDPEGKRLPADCKSLAVALTFQDFSRTLTASEVDQMMEKVTSHLAEDSGIQATIRK